MGEATDGGWKCFAGVSVKAVLKAQVVGFNNYEGSRLPSGLLLSFGCHFALHELVA